MPLHSLLPGDGMQYWPVEPTNYTSLLQLSDTYEQVDFTLDITYVWAKVLVTHFCMNISTISTSVASLTYDSSPYLRQF